MAYKLYLRMRIREVAVKKQIQQILLYVQETIADIQKENVLEDLETGILEYKTTEEFLADLKKEFGEEEEEIIKAAELRRLKQEEKIMEEFV